MPISELSRVDPDWLTGTLATNGHLTAGRVESVKHVVLKTSKFLDVVRLQVGYSADASCESRAVPPTKLILKFGKPDREIKRSLIFAHREFEFYNSITRSMDSPPTARCYDATFEPQSGGFHFLLEDLSATHTHVGNPLPPSVLECEQIVECLARFHAAWWNDSRIGTEIGRPYGEERSSKRMVNIQRRTDRFLRLLGDRISPARRVALLDQCALYPRLLERQGAGHLTIIHGDAHSQNFLIAAGRSDCRIIDWEDWELAPPTDDLAYMIAVRWFAERRERVEQDLLRRYHCVLIAAGVRDYSWDAFWSDYRLSVVKHLCTPTYQWVTGVPAATWWNNLERILMSYEDLACAQIIELLKSS